MSAPTNPQIIFENGHPAFAVLPWSEYQALLKQADPADVWLPHEVVQAVALDGATLVKAWRDYRGLTQAELAKQSGMSQPALARLEKGGITPRPATLKKLAAALGVEAEQLTE
ncbi:MAG: helix-turn-helix transcriptional regulator [Deltaproteobacteria bacterium]|nr:helix-turn-helix transcriptional regulator [Candidatus Anaeroferrophillacea bacterium]